jgi:hypothetical protein
MTNVRIGMIKMRRTPRIRVERKRMKTLMLLEMTRNREWSRRVWPTR